MANPTVNRFLNAKVSKKAKFMDQDIEILKLTVSQVLEIQELAKDMEKNQSDANSMDILMLVVKSGAPELNELTEEEIRTFPMDELTKLSNEIMKYSGLGAKPEK